MPNSYGKTLLLSLFVAETIFVIYSAIFLFRYGCLPPPFFYVSSDSFMDFFHVNFWADMEGRYEQWRSIYPIAVFAFAKLIRSQTCDGVYNAFELRSCDLHSIWYLLSGYIIGVLVVWHKLTKIDDKFGDSVSKKWKVVALLTMLLSLQGLFALERGNYIVLAMLFLALSTPIGKSSRSAFYLALAINIKQYLLFLLFIPAIKQKFSYIVECLAFAIFINFFALIFVHETHYSTILENMRGFTNNIGSDAYYLERIWDSISLASWHQFAYNSFAINNFFSAGTTDLIRSLISVVLLVLQALAFGTIVLLYIHRDKLSLNFIALALMMSFTAVTDIPGGYALILSMPFIGGIATRQRRIWYLTLFFLMYLPIEFPVGPAHQAIGPSFLGNLNHPPSLNISLGSIWRPIISAGLVGLLFIDLLIPKCKINPDKKSEGYLCQ